MKNLRKTKIVGTIGPASENRLEELNKEVKKPEVLSLLKEFHLIDTYDHDDETLNKDYLFGDEKEEQPENNNVTNNDVQKDNTIANPKTGDNVIVYAVSFIIALLGIIALIIVNNTKRKNSRKH